jgi:hypothetical protein
MYCTDGGLVLFMTHFCRLSTVTGAKVKDQMDQRISRQPGDSVDENAVVEICSARVA